MEIRNAAYLRLVENDEDRSGQPEGQYENEPDRFAPLGTVKVLAEAFRTIRERLRYLESAHRGIQRDEDYVARKGEFMAAGELVVEMAAEPAAGMVGASAAETGRIYTEFENAFCWLHTAISGYFDQVAELYTETSKGAKNAQGSVNSYLPNTFESLLKTTFPVARTKYLQEAITAAAALVILGILPAGIRQIRKEYREHVRERVLAIIQDLGLAHAFRYVPDKNLFRLLGASAADFERHLEGQLAAKNTEVAMTIFAIRSRIETPNHETLDAAARITNLTELEVVE